MSLKSKFLVFKKSCTSCPNWGGVGGGKGIWTKSTRIAAFHCDAFPYLELLFHEVMIFGPKIGINSILVNFGPILGIFHF